MVSPPESAPLFGPCPSGFLHPCHGTRKALSTPKRSPRGREDTSQLPTRTGDSSRASPRASARAPRVPRAPPSSRENPKPPGTGGCQIKSGLAVQFWRSAPFWATCSLMLLLISLVLLQVSALQHVKTSRCKHGAGGSPRARLQSRSSLFFGFQLKHPQGSRISSSTWKGKSFPGRKRASSSTPTPTWQRHSHKGTVRAKQT